MYDLRGNLISKRYFGSDGNPIVAAIGYHAVVVLYNRRDRLMEELYFDINFSPVALPGDFVRRTWAEDLSGRLQTVTGYDDENRIVFFQADSDTLELTNGDILFGIYFGGTQDTVRFIVDDVIQTLPVSEVRSLKLSGTWYRDEALRVSHRVESN